VSLSANTIIKWSALFFTLSGALCTVLKLDPANIFLLNTGSVLYLTWSIRVKDLNLSIVNGVLLAIYIGGAILRI
jgi:hypothetical protein